MMLPPPPVYCSAVDFGPYMEVPVDNEMSFEAQLKYGIPDRITIKTRTYKFYYYEAEHHWMRRESWTDFMNKAKIKFADADESFWWWFKNNSGYPETADMIVEIKPAWIYRLLDND